MAFAFLGDQLLTKGGLRPTAEVLAGKDVVVLYFSASWCPPCQQFTPQLANFYNAHHAAKRFEVVFVSNDRDEASMIAYYNAKMPFSALPYGSQALQRVASAGYCGRGIPDVCIVGPQGEVVKRGAVQNVMADPGAQAFPWPDRPTTKGATVEFPVELTLEELYAGCTKKRRIKRKRVRGAAVVEEPSEVLEVVVQPGWKAGTKMTFPNEGDETHAQMAGDVVFVMKEKPHETYVREGNDIVHRPQLSAAGPQTLCLKTLDGAETTVTLEPHGTATLEGKGMPVRKQGQRVGVGSLLVQPVWQ
eukprot:Hpha_TRINITY_DN8588_c0_g1::TRINITY_DN8588_c0_g1_i1::g.146621::m.146621